MTIHLNGLTWDHPRATSPLRAAAAPLHRVRPDIVVHWDAQPLAGFEARPISEAAQAYDLVIFDHPHVGEIAARSLFRPLDALLAANCLADRDFVGPSLATYRYAGRTWGLPLDAACQTSCARADLLEDLGVAWPANWAEVLALGELARRRGLFLAIAYAGVHSLMTLLSLSANQGTPLGDEASAQAFADAAGVRRALTAMAALLPYCAPEVLDWNSIAVQDAMCARQDLVFCPAVYGFAPYAHRTRPVPLDYGNLPGLAPGHRGSTIGGAGVGVSTWSTQPEAAAAVARFLTDARVQEDVIAANGGQPARTNAWDAPQVDGRSGHFYSGTRVTLDGAWVRPRFDGYLDFQRAGGILVEAYLRGSASVDATLQRLEDAWTRARTHGG